jgi:hypothetical protein
MILIQKHHNEAKNAKEQVKDAVPDPEVEV